jgi:hypothetical protein
MAQSASNAGRHVRRTDKLPRSAGGEPDCELDLEPYGTEYADLAQLIVNRGSHCRAMNSVKESAQIPFTTAAVPVEDFDSQSDIPAPSLGEGGSDRDAAHSLQAGAPPLRIDRSTWPEMGDRSLQVILEERDTPSKE